MQVALYALLCVIWGSTWLVIKVGYGGLGPFNVAAIRFFIAALVLGALVALVGARWPRGRTEWALIAWIGLVLFFGNYALVYWAEQYIDSAITAILFATLPLITAGVAHVYLPGDRLTPRKLAGTLLAFVGVGALFGDHLRIDPSKALPMLAVVGAAVCSTGAAVASKRHGAALHPAALNAPAMLVGAILLTAASLASGEPFGVPPNAATWGAVLYLAIAGSVVSFLVFFWLLKTWSVTSLSFISIFSPMIAVLLGFVFRGERLTVWTGIGTALILSGVTIALIRTWSPSASQPRQ